MRRVYPLHVEGLEERQLLSRAHAAVAPAPRTAAAPLVLNGTLNVDNHLQGSLLNTDPTTGNTTTNYPVTGQLAGLGQVRGVWTQTADPYGNIQGLDTIRLRDSQGMFVVGFNEQASKPLHTSVRGIVGFEHPQRVLAGTGAYAGASESGTVVVNNNVARGQVVSLTLNTPGS